METIGQRVKRAMDERAIGSNELDALIGMSKGYTSRLVNTKPGKKPRVPGSELLEVIAERLGTTYEWLLKGADGSAPAPRPSGGAPKLTVVRDERYVEMPKVRQSAEWAGIPADFVERWEAKLDFDGQPPFLHLFDLLQASYRADRGRLITQKPNEADF